MKLKIKDIAIFAMLGALMYASKLVMNALPNIHLIGVFIVAVTVVYRRRALYPIYIFVFLTGLFEGFGVWWIPYLYIWAVLWGAVMLLPEKAHPVFLILMCSLHGFLFGVLYAPAQALIFHLSLKSTVSWVIAGFPYDAIHGVSNLICGSILIIPLIKLLKIADKNT